MHFYSDTNLRTEEVPQTDARVELPSSNIINELLGSSLAKLRFIQPTKFYSVEHWVTLDARVGRPWKAFSLNLSSVSGYFERIFRETVHGARGRNMTCLLQSYFSLDGKYSPRKWASFSPRRSERHTCGRVSSRSRNDRWVAFAQLPTAEWRVICIIRLVGQLSRTPSLRSSALGASYSANAAFLPQRDRQREFAISSGARIDISIRIESSPRFWPPSFFRGTGFKR